MPTCTHISYHLEAQRKARVIQKKQAALSSQGRPQPAAPDPLQDAADESLLRKIQHRLELLRISKRSNSVSEQGSSVALLKAGGGGGDDPGHHHRTGTAVDCRHQERVLRNHGLVLGPVG